jgi:hypothetical protein
MPADFNCLYDYDEGNYLRVAYLVQSADWTKYPREDALREITGTGSDDLNMSWYMFMLGGDLDWDLQTPAAALNYDRIKYGNVGRTAGCAGGGSTTGILPSYADPQQPTTQVQQTVAQRLRLAQAVEHSITRSDANALLESIRILQDDSRNAATSASGRKRLLSPLREAAAAIRKVKEDLPPEQGGGKRQSISASPAARLIQTYLIRVEGSQAELGAANANQLAASGQRLLSQIEGETPVQFPAVR